MIGVSSALVPQVNNGLSITVGKAVVYINGTVTFLNTLTTVFLPANSVNYIFLNTATVQIQSNTTGFTNQFVPIAVVTTNSSVVSLIQDYRVDVFFDSGSGGGATYSDAEIPSGTIGGGNTVFTLANVPAPAQSLQLYLNGLIQTAGGVDYTLAGPVITFNTAPQSGDALIAWYRF